MTAATIAEALGLDHEPAVESLAPGCVLVSDGPNRWLLDIARTERRAAEVADVVRALAASSAPVPALESVRGSVLVYGAPALLDEHADDAAALEALVAVHAARAAVPVRGSIERILGAASERYDAARRHLRRAPTLEQAGARLRARLPRAQEPVVVHTTFGRRAARLGVDRRALVVGWSNATMGDPLVDVGALLAFATSDRRALLDRYADATRRDVDDIAVYVALAHWLAGVESYAASARARRDDPTAPRLAPEAEACGRRAISAFDEAV